MKHFFVAGFDFGTSYSKVVLRDQLTGLAKAVTFNKDDSGLLPSFVRIDRKSVLGPESKEGQVILSYPKLIAADATSGGNDFCSLYGDRLTHVHLLLGTKHLEQIAFLALTRYFLSVLDSIHGFISSDDEWNRFDPDVDPIVVQVAVPTGLSARDGKMDELMQNSLATATLIRLKNRMGSPASSVSELLAARRALDSLDPSARQDLNTRCITYPEVAAGVQTVLRSPSTPDGKYITLDVGAGTIDLNAFLRISPRSNDTNNHKRTLDYWACEVRPLGFARLDLGADRRQIPEHEVTVNPLPETEVLGRFQCAIVDLMKSAFRFQPYKVTGNGPSPWASGTFAYVWGGGAAHQPYVDTFLKALQSLRIGVHDINLLPVPSAQFRVPKGLRFGRLAIAYGLSFHQANLEAVRLPYQLRTYEEIYPVRWDDAYGKTGVCSCRGNPSCPRCFGKGFKEPGKDLVPNLRTVQSSAAGAPPAVRHRSRYELALGNLIDNYHKNPRMLVAERVLWLNRILTLVNRPEVQENTSLLSDAAMILQYNLARFGGNVCIRTFSAAITPDGCRVLVHLRRQEREDLEVHHKNPELLKSSIDIGPPPSRVKLGCSIAKTDRGAFVLKASQRKAVPLHISFHHH